MCSDDNKGSLYVFTLVQISSGITVTGLKPQAVCKVLSLV